MEKFNEIKYARPDFAQFKKEFAGSVKKLASADTVDKADSALCEINQLEKKLYTLRTIASIRHDVDMSDTFYEGEVKYFNKSLAMLMPLMKKYNKTLVKSRFRKQLEDKYAKTMFEGAECDLKLQSLWIIPDIIKESELVMQYSKLVATQKTQFNGKEANFYGLLKQMQSQDRSIRKAAFEAWAKLYEQTSAQLDAIYDKLVALRCKQAKKLGLNNYVEQAFMSMHRFDYTPADCASFRKQILDEVTPICAQLARKQAQRLGVDKLKYYDEMVLFPDGNVDPIGGKEVLVPIAQKMYRELSALSGEFFDFMVEHELFDLDTKPNKHMGGYCTILPEYDAPFIFSNFNGTSADVQVLTHEAGHCFNMYLSMRANPMIETVSSTSEVNEIHSMSMELFTLPWNKDFYGEKFEKAKYAHLVESLFTLPYLVSVDEFQHEVFARPTMTAKERRTVWHNIESKYMPWRDYDGNEFLANGGFWMQKQHIFMYPFYYIDYALAEMGAYEFYGKDKANHKTAWEGYVNLCRAGGTKSYLELLDLAKLSNPFNEGSVKKAIGGVVAEINSYTE